MGAICGENALVLRRRQRKGVASAQDEGFSQDRRRMAKSADRTPSLILSKGGGTPPASKDEAWGAICALPETTP